MRNGKMHTWHLINLNVVFEQTRSFSCTVITIYIVDINHTTPWVMYLFWSCVASHWMTLVFFLSGHCKNCCFTQWPLGDLNEILKMEFTILFHWLVSSDLLMIMPSNECHVTLSVISQHWCRQATSHYLNQCWRRSPTSYGVTWPQWVKCSLHLFTLCVITKT